MTLRALAVAFCLMPLAARAADFHGTCSNGKLTTPPQPQTACTVAVNDAQGHTSVTLSDGRRFEGYRISEGQGPLFFLAPGKSNDACHFYFSDHGTFTDGWERRLTGFECPNLSFNRAQ